MEISLVNRILSILVALSIVTTPAVFAQNAQRGLSVAPRLPLADTWGNYHALIIGINDYAKWPRLKTAVKDAAVIRDTLVARYGFDEKNVILRTDKAASRLQITRDLRYLAQSMQKEDNLFIYYAGHGQLDDFTGDGYWVPAEGALKNPETWISNAFIKAILSSEKLRAKNVIVIADSCYSGSMLRGGPSLMSLDDRRYRQKLIQKASLRSRQVISSGGVEPVADGGAEGHSLFAFYLIDALQKNDREVIDLENLFHSSVWKPVTEIGNQRPNVGRLKTPMDQNGQFVLYNAARVKERASSQDGPQTRGQNQVRTQQQTTVASAELELQRQRIEMEKQKLAYEKEQLARQKTLEMERLELEKQKQAVAYAKLQARLAEIEQAKTVREKKAPAPGADSSPIAGRDDYRPRIAVLPFYVEQGQTASGDSNELGRHYRRLSGFITNQLVSQNFEVINPFARDASEEELSRIMGKAKQDSYLVSRDLCQRYGVDAVYIVWLKIKSKKTKDGHFIASAMVDGGGYDSGGRSLGANVLKTFRVKREDFDEAVAIAEKEVGDIVGQALTRWGARQKSSNGLFVKSGPRTDKGVLSKNIQGLGKYIEIRLDQANEYELVEMFGKVLHTVSGVVAARTVSQRIVPGNPLASVTKWQVEIDLERTDSFRLQANIMKMIKAILAAGGTIKINGVPYRYTPSEIKLMKGLMPGGANSRSIQFVIDRERARAKELSHRRNPEKKGQTEIHNVKSELPFNCYAPPFHAKIRQS